MASTINATPTSSGLIQTADSTGVLALQTGGTTAVTISATQNVGIGTATPVSDARLTISSDNTESSIFFQRTGSGRFDTSIGNESGNLVFRGGADASTVAGLTEYMKITGDAGLLQFNSGYGSVATAYGCRAWVNFNGTGTPAIRASGNVSSITDNGTGNYTVNFTTSMPNVNYGTAGSVGRSFASTDGIGRDICVDRYATGSVGIRCGESNTFTASDEPVICLSVFR